MSVGRKHNARTRAAHEAAATITRLTDDLAKARGLLREIVETTSVGKKGSCATRSKWGNYPARLYHAARATLDGRTGDDQS